MEIVRRHQRIPLSGDCRVQMSGQLWTCPQVNISRSGMCLATPWASVPWQPFTVHARIPGPDGDRARLVKLKVRGVWVGRGRMGVEFIDPPQELGRRLSALLA